MKVKIIKNNDDKYFDKFIGQIVEPIYFDINDETFELPIPTENNSSYSTHWDFDEIEIIDGNIKEINGMIEIPIEDYEYYKELEKRYEEIVKIIKEVITW